MYYTESHEWLVVEGTRGWVGISESAKKEIGEIVYIELPLIGQEIRAGEVACVLESTKAAIDIYAPVSGKILAVNERLRASPSSINGSKESWFFEIALSDLSECDKLKEK